MSVGVLGAIAGIAKVVGTVVSVGATAYSAYEAREAGKEEAKLLEQQAVEQQRVAQLRERAFRLESQKLLARQKALWSKAGVLWTEGTPLEVMEETAAEAELQALIIRAGGEAETRRLFGLARIGRAEAKARAIGGYFRAGSSLLAGATTWSWPRKTKEKTFPLEPPT